MLTILRVKSYFSSFLNLHHGYGVTIVRTLNNISKIKEFWTITRILQSESFVSQSSSVAVWLQAAKFQKVSNFSWKKIKPSPARVSYPPLKHMSIEIFLRHRHWKSSLLSFWVRRNLQNNPYVEDFFRIIWINHKKWQSKLRYFYWTDFVSNNLRYYYLTSIVRWYHFIFYHFFDFQGPFKIPETLEDK